MAEYGCPGDVKKALSPPLPPSKKLYKVQVGAYSKKENAEAILSKVIAAGFKDAFIKIE